MPTPHTRRPFLHRAHPPPPPLQTQNYACAQMRVYYKRMSVDPALRGAVFAEIEVDQVEVGAGCWPLGGGQEFSQPV